MRNYLLRILVSILLVLACAKNPLSTRKGEEPAGSTGTWETPATPEVVLLNLLFAYNEMNIQNYALCFGDDFRFSATQDSIEAEAQGNGYLFAFWDRAAEVSTTENIFVTFAAQNKHLDLILSPSTDYPDSIGDSLAVMYRNYIVRIISPDTIRTDTTFIEGLASFSASRSSFNLWSIYFWSELPVTGNQYDWADLKAEYRQ